MLRRTFSSFALISILTWGASAVAQPETPQTENPENDNIIAGTIVSLTTEGRLTTLVVDIDGEEQEFRLTPQIGFQVQGPGDPGFLVEGNYIETRAVMSNDRLFPETLTVFLIGRGDRVPPGVIQPVAATAEVGENRYDISGTIVGTAQDENYPEFTQLAVRSAQNAVLFLREGQSLTVSFNGHEHAAEGDPIELQVMRLRNGRVTLQACRVTKTEAFDSAVILAPPSDE